MLFWVTFYDRSRVFGENLKAGGRSAVSVRITTVRWDVGEHPG